MTPMPKTSLEGFQEVPKMNSGSPIWAMAGMPLPKIKMQITKTAATEMAAARPKSIFAISSFV